MFNFTSSSIESVAADAYNKFHKSHKDLFKENINEYWARASRYKEHMVQKHVYTHTNKKITIFDPTEDIYSDTILEGKHYSKNKMFFFF